MWLFRLVLVIFVLGFADFVFSESTWILWQQRTKSADNSIDDIKEDWDIKQVYSTMVECQKSLANSVHQRRRDNEYWESLEKTGTKVVTHVEGNKGYVTIMLGKPYKDGPRTVTYDLICLPDTIDPRSPKR